MEQIRVAVVGYGNIGRYVVEALEASADFVLAGIVRRCGADGCPVELSAYTVVKQLSDLPGLEYVDVAILCVPSRLVEVYAKECLALGICTVDSFDIHADIPALHRSLDFIAKAKGRVAITAAGWDPGTDSIVRTMLEAVAPKGITYTDFGPGVSMGHTVAARAIKGVSDALSLTIPAGSGRHRRMVYVELEEGSDAAVVEAAIKADAYFAQDDTQVVYTSSVDALKDLGHGVHLWRRGASGKTFNQQFDYHMRINNPALTAQVLVCSARAALRQLPGCYTLVEVPVIDLLAGPREEWLARLV